MKLTTAACEAYFRRPPKTDLIEVEGQPVLACAIADSPWKWNEDWNLLIHKHSGQTKSLADVHLVRVEAQFDKATASWRGRPKVEGDYAIDQTVRAFPTEGIASLLRGQRLERLKALNAQRLHDMQDRVKKFHPRMVDENPSDFISREEWEKVVELAREVMAAMCHLTVYLPRCQILAPKWATRLCEMIEREMISLEQSAQRYQEQMKGEVRALGGGVEEITNSTIERLEQRIQGLRFQYYHCQLVLHGFTQQYEDVAAEYGSIMSSWPGADESGHFRKYVSLRERVRRRKQQDRTEDLAWKAQRAMLLKLPMQDYYRWLRSRQTYQPRLDGVDANDTPAPVKAMPMTAWEIDHEDSWDE